MSNLKEQFQLCCCHPCKFQKPPSSLVVLSAYTHSQETLQRHIFYELIWSFSVPAVRLSHWRWFLPKRHVAQSGEQHRADVSPDTSEHSQLSQPALSRVVPLSCLWPPGSATTPRVFWHSWCWQIMPIMHHRYLCPFKMFGWEFSQRQGSSLNAPQISYCEDNLLFLSNPESYLRVSPYFKILLE